jgi:hypothetical protein
VPPEAAQYADALEVATDDDDAWSTRGHQVFFIG